MHGYNGDTGAVIYAGGGANELMTGTRQWNTGMVARGRIYFGADNKVYAFRLPAGTPTPTPTATATAAAATPTATSNGNSNGYRNSDVNINSHDNSYAKLQLQLRQRLLQRYRLVQQRRLHQCQRRLLHRR